MTESEGDIVYILSDIRNPVFFTIGQSVESCIRQCTGSIALAGTRKQATCGSRLQVTGATPLNAFRFLPECAGWRLRCMRCATGAVGWSSEPQIRRGRPSFFRKHASHQALPVEHLRYGGGAKRAATNLSNFARAERTHCRWLFSEFSMSVAIVLYLMRCSQNCRAKVANKKNHALASGISATTVEIWLPTEPPAGPCRMPASRLSQSLVARATGLDSWMVGELVGQRRVANQEAIRIPKVSGVLRTLPIDSRDGRKSHSESCTHLWSPVPPLAGSAAGGHSWVVMGWKEKTVVRFGGNAPMLGGGPR